MRYVGYPPSVTISGNSPNDESERYAWFTYPNKSEDRSMLQAACDFEDEQDKTKPVVCQGANIVDHRDY